MAGVPFATNLLPAAPDIANARGTDLSWIGNLPDAYWAGQNQAYQQRQRNAFQEGPLPKTLQELGERLLRIQGTAAAPEYVSLGNLGVIQDIANRPPPPFNPNIGGSGYTTPGRQTSAEPQPETPPSPTAGTSTLRQMAEAKRGTLDELIAASGGANPDQSLDFGQRQAVIANLRQPQAFGDRFPPFKTSGNVSVAGTPTGGTLPPSIGSPTPPAPPAQVAQARPQAPQGPADPMAQQQELQAAKLMYTAQILRQRAAAAAGAGPAGKAVAEQISADAAAKEQEARDIHKSLLERGMPTQAARDALNPAIRQSKADEESDKLDRAAFAKSYGQASSLANAAGPGLQRVEDMKALIQAPTFYSGPLAKGVQTFQQYRAAFGRDPSTAQPMEAFNKGVKDIVTEQIRALAGSGVGRVLQSEVRNIQSAVATLDNSPAGNRTQLETLRRTYQLQAGVGQIADQVSQAVATGRIPPGQAQAAFNQAVRQYADAHPMFSPQEVKDPRLVGAVDAPPDYAKMSGPQRRQWGAQHNVGPNDAIRLSNGVGQPWTYIHAD